MLDFFRYAFGDIFPVFLQYCLLVLKIIEKLQQLETQERKAAVLREW